MPHKEMGTIVGQRFKLLYRINQLLEESGFLLTIAPVMREGCRSIVAILAAGRPQQGRVIRQAGHIHRIFTSRGYLFHNRIHHARVRIHNATLVVTAPTVAHWQYPDSFDFAQLIEQSDVVNIVIIPKVNNARCNPNTILHQVHGIVSLFHPSGWESFVLGVGRRSYRHMRKGNIQSLEKMSETLGTPKGVFNQNPIDQAASTTR
mmetsp:Transcript_15160/g.33165  ORF Transcript_15160/g.33165 Transcript_15160/m.33165 type:complete len:205 (-) Transcript_15160:759-1373(-)